MKNFDMSSLQVLLVEDDRFMRKMLARTLKNLGVKKIEEASDGSEGLDKVKEYGHELSLIICDLNMPQMNGFGFVFRLRTSSDIPNPLVPVIIVSGHGDTENQELSVKLGISGFLEKPTTGILLENEIINALTNPMREPLLESLKEDKYLK